MSPFDYEQEELKQVIAHMEQNNGQPFFFKEPKQEI